MKDWDIRNPSPKKPYPMVIKGCNNNLTNRVLFSLETNTIAKTSMSVALKEAMLKRMVNLRYEFNVV